VSGEKLNHKNILYKKGHGFIIEGGNRQKIAEEKLREKSEKGS